MLADYAYPALCSRSPAPDEEDCAPCGPDPVVRMRSAVDTRRSPRNRVLLINRQLLAG